MIKGNFRFVCEDASSFVMVRRSWQHSPATRKHCGVPSYTLQQVRGEDQSALSVGTRLHQILQRTDTLRLSHIGPYRHFYSTALAYHTRNLRLSVRPISKPFFFRPQKSQKCHFLALHRTL